MAMAQSSSLDRGPQKVLVEAEMDRDEDVAKNFECIIRGRSRDDVLKYSPAVRDSIKTV